MTGARRAPSGRKAANKPPSAYDGQTGGEGEAMLMRLLLVLAAAALLLGVLPVAAASAAIAPSAGSH